MSDRILDLRSDTVTVPSAEMRRAMYEAEVGDDVFGEDPTVRRLEEMAAEVTGKEAALFVSSGSMGNLIALLSHCQRADEAICGSEAHVLHYEVGGAGGVASVTLRAARNDARGRLDPAEVESLIRGENVHTPRTSLLMLENTHNRCSGAVISVEDTQQLCDLAHQHGVAVHIDGARIFNAALALGVPLADVAGTADSVGFCLSKGLGAPVGSLVCGDGAFISSARKNRKMLGGGMRQAGIIAAAGVWALQNMVERMAEDHANAKVLAYGLAEIPTIDLQPDTIETNIVIFRTSDAVGYARALKASGVLCTMPGPDRLRMVTHYGIERADIDTVLVRARGAALAAV